MTFFAPEMNPIAIKNPNQIREGCDGSSSSAVNGVRG